MNSIFIKLFFEFFPLKILSTNELYKYLFLKKTGNDKYIAIKTIHNPE